MKRNFTKRCFELFSIVGKLLGKHTLKVQFLHAEFDHFEFSAINCNENGKNNNQTLDREEHCLSHFIKLNQQRYIL